MTYSPVWRDRKNILLISGTQTDLPPAWCIKSSATFIMYYHYCAALNLIQHQRKKLSAETQFTVITHGMTSYYSLGVISSTLCIRLHVTCHHLTTYSVHYNKSGQSSHEQLLIHSINDILYS